MIQTISYNPLNKAKVQINKTSSGVSENIQKEQTIQNNYTNPVSFSSLSIVNTTLSEADKKKYLYLIDTLKSTPISPNSEGIPATKQLEILLRNGKLLQKSSHDKSTTLDNLYNMASTKRAYNLSTQNLLSNTLDILTNPRYVTQTFGDIPAKSQEEILKTLDDNDEVKKNPNLMNVYASGTCAAASIEVNMADKYPSEFARWVSELSSENKRLDLNVKLTSISKNIPEAIEILNLLDAKKTKFSFYKVGVNVDVDQNAYIRAFIQNKYWDKGERNVADVLVQSAIMKLGSQNTYNSLTDVRAGMFNSNPQGLIELEKTFVESLIKNKEISSLVYQQIDDNQNLVGYNCSFDKIAKHITDTIDSGDDVILGYILTNETAGITSQQGYKQTPENAPNKVINGHEITVVDYYKSNNGQLVFVCVDTDDDNPKLVQYSADWLLPKIHHAGYPAHLVASDEKEIMKHVA